MPTRLRHAVKQIGAQFGRQHLQLRTRQTPQVRGIIDRLQQWIHGIRHKLGITLFSAA